MLGEIASQHPEAGIWAIIAREEVMERIGIADRTRTLLPSWEFLLRHFRALTPLYPALVRARRLPAADLLLTSSFAFSTAFRTVGDAPQLCYCHSPLRFAWSMTSEYGRQLGFGPLGSAALRALAAAMRWSDRRAARRVTRFVANSDHVAEQIRRFYGRRARVVRPPVDTTRFRPADDGGHDGYFLFCSRLVESYKRPSLAVEAFRGLGAELIVAGDGPAMADLQRMAPANVRFRGHLGDDELISLMQRCAALVFPSRDDFGLMPVEVMACGRPVLAFAGGGALETVVPGETGELFAEQTSAALRAAVRKFDPDSYDVAAIRSHAEGFGVERFRRELAEEALAAARGERS